jgi:hypothetical protein
MNFLGLAAVICGVIAFAAAFTLLRSRRVALRWLFLGGFSVLAIPSLWFCAYYLHVFPEYEWFYLLRSWPGSEFLVVFLGGAGGALAALLPRVLLVLPLSALVFVGLVPYMKPLAGPMPAGAFSDRSQGDICLQSTPSTCGPASVTTILRKLGVSATEEETARAAFTYQGGTEAWYLARYIRSRGLAPQFAFRRTFSPSVGLPSVVGVRVGGLGHFIAVLHLRDGVVTFADPMRGEEHLPLAEFLRRYEFTGFHLVVQRR